MLGWLVSEGEEREGLQKGREVDFVRKKFPSSFKVAPVLFLRYRRPEAGDFEFRKI